MSPSKSNKYLCKYSPAKVCMPKGRQSGDDAAVITGPLQQRDPAHNGCLQPDPDSVPHVEVLSVCENQNNGRRQEVRLCFGWVPVSHIIRA